MEVQERIVVMRLNLSEIVWPICLLKCDAALRQLRVGEALDLMFKDRELIDAVSRIIISHPHLTYEINQAGDYHHIIVHRLQMTAEMMDRDKKQRHQLS